MVTEAQAAERAEKCLQRAADEDDYEICAYWTNEAQVWATIAVRETISQRLEVMGGMIATRLEVIGNEITRAIESRPA